jgi:hypothetical protein
VSGERPEGVGTVAPNMPTLALRFGLLFVLATSVFCFAAELGGQGAGGPCCFCNQAPALCTNSQPLVSTAAVMFIAYLVLDPLNR